ncbi:MAG TPA: ferritin-like domain-containing protein [Polyangia bacterium]|nr:ferritin-like domain-containing protein [Polyangia bacterium]
MSNPTKPTQTGPNRTGIATSPIDSKATIEGAQAGSPAPVFEPPGLLATRIRYATKVGPVGTMPPPASLKGMATTAVEMVKGNKPTVFLDLLGERLAFERTGTRLYEALLIKLEAADPHPGGPTRFDLERIRDEELEHFGLLKRTMESLGADPTAMTPSADVIAVASRGLVEAVSDPRVTLNESLKAVLAAELVDNDSWLTLSDVAERLGHAEMAAEFRGALAQEEDHLARVRSWLNVALEGEAGITSHPGDGTTASVPAP